MRAACLVAALTLFLTGWSQARLGETLNECIERYGPVIETRQAELAQSDAEMAVFSKASVTVLVEFKNGKAWHIRFRKPLLSLTEQEALLKANAADEDWSPPFVAANRTFRISPDRSRLSVLYERTPGIGSVFDVMSREYIEQYRANALDRLRKPGAVEEMRRSTSPLPGF